MTPEQIVGTWPPNLHTKARAIRAVEELLPICEKESKKRMLSALKQYGSNGQFKGTKAARQAAQAAGISTSLVEQTKRLQKENPREFERIKSEENSMRPRKTGWIYLARSRHELIKIGWTRNIQERERAHRRSDPFFKIILAVHGDIQVERALHKRFSAKRIANEWFKLSLGAINSLKKELLKTT